LKVARGIPGLSSVRHVGRCERSTKRLISSFSEAASLIRRRSHPRSLRAGTVRRSIPYRAGPRAQSGSSLPPQTAVALHDRMSLITSSASALVVPDSSLVIVCYRDTMSRKRSSLNHHWILSLVLNPDTQRYAQHLVSASRLSGCLSTPRLALCDAQSVSIAPDWCNKRLGKRLIARFGWARKVLFCRTGDECVTSGVIVASHHRPCHGGGVAGR